MISGFLFGLNSFTPASTELSRELKRSIESSWASSALGNPVFLPLQALLQHEFNPSIWVVVKIMVPFWIPILIRHLMFRAPKKGP